MVLTEEYETFFVARRLTARRLEKRTMNGTDQLKKSGEGKQNNCRHEPKQRQPK